MIPRGIVNRRGPDGERDRLLEQVIARHHNSGDALIEILHAAQQLYGYLSPGLLKKVAHSLKLPPSRVLGVATFYHLFRFEPPKEHSAVVCMGTACYVAGGAALESTAKQVANPEKWIVGTGRCVGSCGLAPVVICDGSALSSVTPAQLKARMER